ncbi:MAG TPA: TIGR03118 family protein [Terriglobales bacterium]
MKLAMKILKPIMVLAFVVPLLPLLTFAQYTRTDLVSNQEGVAPNTDAHLVNGWGLVQRRNSPSTFSPFWVNDNGTGFSTLYTGTGAQIALFVSVPPAPGSPAGTLGTPTGIVGNIIPTDFTITENGKSGPAFFIFATLDGTISAWNPVVDGSSGLSHATLAADRSSVGAVYTGLAIASNTEGQFLYAADDGPNRRIDMFDATFTFVNSFDDPKIPRDFAPYGIQTINGEIWVTYTSLKKGMGGFVDVFNTDGSLKTRFAVNGPLHSPWGLAQAPADFGPMSNAILVSNNIPRGRINAFDPTSGAFLGPLRDASGKPIEIDNVWSLQFGQDTGPNTAHNQLFFTAGPNNYANGLYGVITVGP